ncbi:hypothetical protein [Leptospira noguchii]|uniref:hypothetical protein n=1 Tax=Leptospira noguchii TaxID=28182 RepID=UPI001FB71DAD|nr:hypothetical protein [Leptospira noguchii]UOG31880.1 hypothetical protein MAL06_07825 [Leptospira noguchii]UOG51330.1 hypothetical protein MAL09_11430 [Leptospira noguchii]
MKRKELNETLFTKAFETQHNAFLWVALWVVSHFNYEICELRRRPIGSRCIEFIIRPNFLTSNSR